MNNIATEIRTKLHIKESNNSEVKNLWMCLDYDQKPTVSYVIDHIKKNLLNRDADISECKLYLDNYWLPPYESSRLIRENDCIKVQVDYNESSHLKLDSTQAASTVEKLTELNKNVLKHIKATEEKKLNEKQLELERAVQKGLSPSEIATVEAATKQNVDYYNHYYDTKASYHPIPTTEQEKNINAYNYWLNNDYFNDQMTQNIAPVESEAKTSKNKSIQNRKSPKQQQNTSCNRKFSIGGYAHLLNEPVQPVQESKTSKKSVKSQKKQFEDVAESDNLSEEQIIDKYYDAIEKKTNTKNQKQNDNSQDFEKIVANVNATGNKKWKNPQPTKQNGPKHIIFRSSSDESSSESENDKQTTKPITEKPASTSPAKKINLESKSVSKYYEPTKQEQLDSVSYNRSYFIKNTKNVIDFKKTFNEEKLNAPQSEEFADNSTYPTEKVNKKSNKQLNTSTDSTSSENSSPSKKRDSKSPSKVNKIDYDKLQSLVGAPRVNDQVAFQILEISSNFTPEISDYKTGKVIDFNENTNEITLELNNKYNQVLKRSNKFSVILDETDKELEEVNEKERRQSQSNDNILHVDWRNLMNLKLIPGEKEITKLQEFNTESRNMIIHV